MTRLNGKINFILIGLCLLTTSSGFAKTSWRSLLGLDLRRSPLIVLRVAPNKCADVLEKNHLVRGDEILEVNGKTVHNLVEFEKACAANASGPLEPWRFVIRRSGRVLEASSPHFRKMNVLNGLGCGLPH